MELLTRHVTACVRGRTDHKFSEALHRTMERETLKSRKRMKGVTEDALRGNLLLAAVPGDERHQLALCCEHVDLAFGDVLYEQGAGIDYVYFPTGSFISLLSSMEDIHRLEVGLIGVEGMLGVSLMLGVGVAPLRAVVQGTGPALRIETRQFSRELLRSPGLTRVLNRYLYVLMSQLAQMVACTRFHMVEARLARWVLMTGDRTPSNDLHLTQGFLAQMLGVRRAGIVRAAGALRRRKLIRYNRGAMSILDRRGLENSSCSCYATARDLHARVMR
jgi:CRP-like cAMP-binding protein